MQQNNIIESLSPTVGRFGNTKLANAQPNSLNIQQQCMTYLNTNKSWKFNENHLTIETLSTQHMNVNSKQPELRRNPKQMVPRKISVSPEKPKSIEQLKNEIRIKQENKKKLRNKIKNLVTQIYDPILQLQNVKQVTEEWTQLAEIGIKAQNNKCPRKNQRKCNENKSIETTSDTQSRETFGRMTQNYPQIRNYYNQLVERNHLNKSFIKQFINQLKAPQHLQKFEANYAKNLNYQHEIKLESLFCSERKSKVYNEDRSKQMKSGLNTQKIIKKLAGIPFRQPSIEQGRLSLLKKRNITENSSFIGNRQFSSSILDSKNLQALQKTRKSIFGDIKRTMNLLVVQTKKKSSYQLPMILKRYRAMTTTKQEKAQKKYFKNNQEHQIISISQRLHTNDQQAKTQTYNYLNSKTQILNSKRKKYALKNIQLGGGGEVDYCYNMNQDIDTIREESSEGFYLEGVNQRMQKQNPHRHISQFSEVLKKRKLNRLAFIEQLKEHLNQKSSYKASPLLTESSIKQIRKPVKIVSMSPDRVFNKSPGKSIPSTNKTFKDKYLKLNKQSSSRHCTLKNQKIYFSFNNPEEGKPFLGLS